MSSTSARVLVTSAGLGTVVPLVPASTGGGAGPALVIQHNAGTSVFTATTAIDIVAPRVTVPGVTFTGAGVAFSQGISALGTSTLVNVAAQTVTAAVANVTTINPAVPGGGVRVNADVSIRGDLEVTGSVNTIDSSVLTVRDKVVTLGAIDADSNSTVDPDDSTRDGAGVVVAGAPRDLPVDKNAAMYEHSMRWDRRGGDFLPGGTPIVAHNRPRWTFRGGALGVASPDHEDREAQFFFAPTYSATKASLGLYYALDDGRTRLVHTFDAPAFGNASPEWKTRQNLVACVGEARARTFVALRAQTYAVVAGSLPAGTTLSASGVMSGAATTAGTYVFTVRASRGVATAERAFVYVVSPPAMFYAGLQAPRWTTRQADVRPVPEGAGVALRLDAWDPYQAATYNDAVRYSVVRGALPAGCGIAPVTGVLSTTGWLRTPGAYSFTVRAQSEASNLYSDKDITITCVAAPSGAAAIVGVLTSKGPSGVSVAMTDALSVAPTVDSYAYVSFHQQGVPSTTWPIASVGALADQLSVTYAGVEAFTHRPARTEYPGATPLPARENPCTTGAPVTLRFYSIRDVGQLRIPRDLGDMDETPGSVSFATINGRNYTAETSFVPASGSPGACCNGGAVRSAPAAMNWVPRGVYNDYVGGTSTLCYIPGTPGIQTMAGEYMEIRLPGAFAIRRYGFDPTVADVPASWSLLGLTQYGIWEQADAHDDVPQPLSETDFGTAVSDVSADRAYPIAGTAEYHGYRLVVRSTTGLVGNTVHLSGLSLVLNPVQA